MSWRGEYIEKKYAEVEDKPIEGRSSKRHAPKKAKHKHSYKNCVLCWVDDSWLTFSDNGANRKSRVVYMLASYCTECGKVGEYDKSDRFFIRMQEDARKRNLTPSFFGYLSQQYIDAALDNYEVFEVSGPFDKFVSFRKDYA